MREKATRNVHETTHETPGFEPGTFTIAEPCVSRLYVILFEKILW